MDNPASIFIDTELEALKRALLEAVIEFNCYKARNTIQTTQHHIYWG
jgi:hypothetical protein